MLASWSGGDVYERDADTAAFLSGDLELPEDVELAAAALERLVPLYRSPANHYRPAPAALDDEISELNDLSPDSDAGIADHLNLFEARELWIDVAARLRAIAPNLAGA